MPDRFNVSTLRAAKSIILTPEGASTDERWEHETPYLAGMIDDHCGTGNVLDFGCGVGRLAKALIERSPRTVLGVDTSASMRALSAAYVDNPHFAACDPAMLPLLRSKAPTVISVWVLQHIPDFFLALEQIDAAMMGRLFVVNNLDRALPTPGGWHNDGLDVRAALRTRFREVAGGVLDPAHIPPVLVRNAFWAVYERR